VTASTPHFPSRLHLHRHDLNASDWLPGSLVSMAAVQPLTPRRGTQPSHLRQISNGTSSNSRPLSAAPSESGTVHRIPVPVKPPIERVCVLWNHDEGFFKDEVVINLDLFPDVKAGELLAITASKTDARDFQDKAQISKKDVENVANALQRERSNSNPRSPGRINDAHPKHDVDLGKRYLFIAKDMTKDMKAKQPTLQVSVAKHITDLFCLKNRSNVRITTVSILA
jgi:DEP domain-containing protein 5